MVKQGTKNTNDNGQEILSYPIRLLQIQNANAHFQSAGLFIISKMNLFLRYDVFFERELRLKDRVEKRILEEMEVRMSLLEGAIEDVNEQLERPVIENDVGTEPVVAMPWLLDDLIELDQQSNVIEPSDVNLVSEHVSGGSAWTIWRTISAIIGTLGVIYFAAVCGLAFGYILDRRA